MIYLDSCVLLKFIKREAETDALRSWRQRLPPDTELLTSELAELEITRALLRIGVDHERVPYLVDQAVHGVYVADLTSTVLARAKTYRTAKLGSLDAVHLATADPFRGDLTAFVTYDHELATAARDVGLPTHAPT
ncbi:type II toxin-antitoxin system VapC family toxin [Actinophytocola gossypii]|uniref:Type II toxin-antitoxin system VapC family toxin n=1 Tax=Actinophytocola gossypii TaxID=2812003 RepID=A0ABT2J3D0_9PSEU|nr:type II toxin-antitoxin system VapC family toxin [Actinophytocola gossypii]MCT2582357.1 type II toxin-antitoxin system VapC family toxin [Actinophytocola gossypii]